MGCGFIGVIGVTAPSAVAAAGLYFLDRFHYHANTIKEVGGGLNGLQTLKADLIAKVKGGTNEATQTLPKLAPEFDGLHCFETLVTGCRHSSNF